MCIEQILDASKAFLTPLIAIIAVYIAWQQWQTSKKKLCFDLYEKRPAIFSALMEFLAIVVRDLKVTPAELFKFRDAVYHAEFIFGKEIRLYLDEVYEHGAKLQRFTGEYRDRDQIIPEGYNHNTIVDGMHSEAEWFVGQFDVARARFKKYFTLGDST